MLLFSAPLLPIFPHPSRFPQTNPPQPGPEDGPLYTQVAVEVFRLLTQQVQHVQENSNSLMLFKTARAIIDVRHLLSNLVPGNQSVRPPTSQSASQPACRRTMAYHCVTE